ncbi:chemotaxis protein MotB [Formivibrio citricus]|uniref:Chemotaxis protein MotB n=1 Tax=Formivibrio citricus TaxID=83765 RepID=A0A1I4V086_9NEIS|nr:flagellar motor protein MotD [Formivibrio citricus]SFM94624.1 chemotaxis protein MotB [Formivibrio citricus]
MARKPRHVEHENHERWLVSYADFITLLFAFFVVMYAISSVNEGKYKVLSDSLVNAFQNVPPTSPNQQQSRQLLMGAAPKEIKLPTPSADPQKRDPKADEQARKMQGMAGNIKQSLGPFIDQGKVRVTQSRRGIAIEINDSVLFNPAKADLQGDSIAMLRAVADMVTKTDNLIQIEGHTDNVPINTAQFPSNWELSSARAASVVRVFAETGIAPQRLVVIGYADQRPVESNDKVEGRARNRRVTLNILADNRDEVAVLAP